MPCKIASSTLPTTGLILAKCRRLWFWPTAWVGALGRRRCGGSVWQSCGATPQPPNRPRNSRPLWAPVLVGFTASKVLGCELTRRLRTATMMLPHDYINFKFTSTRTMETGDASGTGFFDVKQRCLMPSGWPRLVGTSAPSAAAGGAAPVGRVVSAAGATWSGLAEGTPVAAGGGDNMMSAIGGRAAAPGVVSFGHPARRLRSDCPVIDTEGLIAPFCGSSGDGCRCCAR